jgi:hypothetical protein
MVVVFAQVPVGNAEPFPPFDEAYSDPALVAFRRHLADVVDRRDLPALKQLMDAEIRTSLGGTGGIEEAVQLFVSEPDRWEALGRILRQGGKFESPDRFVGPYTFFAATEGVDPYRLVVITGEGVNIRATGSFDGKVIGRLSHETALVPEGSTPFSDRPWVALQLDDGSRGYAHETFARSPLDYRAEFRRSGGKWVLASFLAGD